MIKPERNKRISKVDTYLNCAENYEVIPAKELEWYLKEEHDK